MHNFSADLIRWLEFLNRSWPHAQHQLYNGAMAATALSSVARCLSNHLPPTMQPSPESGAGVTFEAAATTGGAAAAVTAAGRTADAATGGASRLPSAGTAGVPDLIILELGSMADRLHLPDVERVVRMLLALSQPPPALLFLTVRVWCMHDLGFVKWSYGITELEHTRQNRSRR